MREIRSSIFDLHTAEEQSPASLRRSMLDLVAEASANTDMSPAVRISGAVDTLVPPPVAEHALAVLREGASNAVRRAHASDIVVMVGGLVVVDDDNGGGHATGGRQKRPAQPGAAGQGVRRRYHRVRQPRWWHAAGVAVPLPRP